MAKGVGMIEPAMATMLVVLTTDAPVGRHRSLRQLLRQAVARTFNRISVDGDGSTSDTVALLATGTAPHPRRGSTPSAGLHAVCADLADAGRRRRRGRQPGRGRHRARGATEDDAERLARAVATSLLVRAAIHGADPNWGRILMAMGTAGVAFDPRGSA
jgi:glutamate N-acetyltransferase / amino-acid N-acetyltransferase